MNFTQFKATLFHFLFLVACVACGIWLFEVALKRFT